MLKSLRKFLLSDIQSISLTNILAFVFSILALGLVIILALFFGYVPTMPFIVLAAVLFLVVIVLNRSGFSQLGRLLFCLLPIYGTLAISIYGKFANGSQTYIIYFDSRFLLLAASVFPLIVFDLKERISLMVCVLSSVVCLFLFDPIHNWLGVGYYQRGFEAPSYYYINYIIFIAYIAMMACLIFLKWQHVTVLSALKKRNSELREVSKEVEAQNEELLQQQEEIITNQEKLSMAHNLISEQAQALETFNKELQHRVAEKSSELLKSNEELVKTNNELRQFSFSVSHNLRGPVARLLGLTSLIEINKNENDLRDSLQFIKKSASELDEILHDLTSIIEIRSEIYRIREKIKLQGELDKSIALIGAAAFIDVDLKTDFMVDEIYGIRPMLQSVLYNLLTNSLKYRNPSKPLQIRVKSYSDGLNKTVVEIADNGLGFDKKTNEKNLFKIYKRFHNHVSGKGLGLYLVHTQIEIMGGSIDVESSPNDGATFRLMFPIPDDVNKQVFFENDSAQLYYDAHINNTVIIWRKNVTSAEYREAFETVLNTLRKYNTPGWIADLRNQGMIGVDDQKWFIERVLKAAAENKLKRIAAIGLDEPIRLDYYTRMIENTAKFGIDLKVFHSMEEGVAWMREF